MFTVIKINNLKYVPVIKDTTKTCKKLVTELIETNDSKNLVIEHYKEFELFFDKEGNLIKKVPTGKNDYLCYFK